MESLLGLLTSLTVSAPAGFNAYLALLLVGFGDRVGWITLAAPYDALSSAPALVILVVMLTVEIVADKVPAVDSVNDLIGTVVRPASGAAIFAGTNQSLTETAPVAALLLGALGAGGLHAFKAGTRPIWTASTGGLANPVVSVFEDLFVGATVVLGMLAAPIGIAVLLITLILLVYGVIRLRRGVRRRLGSA